MPECYTHVFIGNKALARSGTTVASQAAFIAGANGPDPLYMYQIWRAKRTPDLPALALRMHREKTGEFLQTLVGYATTATQQSFVLGYLTHYTTDCILNPYIDAMCAAGAPFAGAGKGRWRMGAALDSALYYRDYKSTTVPLAAGTPMLIGEELAGVCTLLRQALLLVYEVEVPLVALADAYHHNRTVRKAMISKTGAKKPLVELMQAKGTTKYGGPLAQRMQPGPRLPWLPQHWQNPHTGQPMQLLMDEVLALAEQTGAVCIAAAMGYWLGEVDDERLAGVLGNNEYNTGLPCGGAKPAPAKAEPTTKESEQTA